MSSIAISLFADLLILFLLFYILFIISSIFLSCKGEYVCQLSSSLYFVSIIPFTLVFNEYT